MCQNLHCSVKHSNHLIHLLCFSLTGLITVWKFESWIYCTIVSPFQMLRIVCKKQQPRHIWCERNYANQLNPSRIFCRKYFRCTLSDIGINIYLSNLSWILITAIFLFLSHTHFSRLDSANASIWPKSPVRTRAATVTILSTFKSSPTTAAASAKPKNFGRTQLQLQFELYCKQ